MVKYNNAFKERLSRECLLRRSGLWSIAKKHKIDISQLRYWSERYRIHGPGCFEREEVKCSREQKVFILEHMRSKCLSKRETAAQFNLPSFSMIGKWEQEMSEDKKEPIKKDVEPKDFREAYEQLKMENEYLKKLYALVRKQRADKKHR
jgi:transposase-like protein